MVSVIIVAAGRSTRMAQFQTADATPPDKLFLPLGKMPVLAHCLMRIQQCSEVDETVIVTRAERLQDIRNLTKEFSLTKVRHIIEGGAERQDSVWNGLQVLNSAAELVAVHDGARPFFPVSLMPQLITVARQYGSAVVCTKVTDTIKEVDIVHTGEVFSPDLPPSLNVVRTVDRAKLRAVQTPQVFQVPLLKRAYSRVRNNKLQVTDEAAAAEFLGEKVQLVENPSPNPKITTPLDLQYAKLLLR